MDGPSHRLRKMDGWPRPNFSTDGPRNLKRFLPQRHNSVERHRVWLQLGSDILGGEP
jgi:hypothetical protein